MMSLGKNSVFFCLCCAITTVAITGPAATAEEQPYIDCLPEGTLDKINERMDRALAAQAAARQALDEKEADCEKLKASCNGNLPHADPDKIKKDCDDNARKAAEQARENKQNEIASANKIVFDAGKISREALDKLRKSSADVEKIEKDLHKKLRQYPETTARLKKLLEEYQTLLRQKSDAMWKGSRDEIDNINNKILRNRTARKDATDRARGEKEAIDVVGKLFEYHEDENARLNQDYELKEKNTQAALSAVHKLENEKLAISADAALAKCQHDYDIAITAINTGKCPEVAQCEEDVKEAQDNLKAANQEVDAAADVFQHCISSAGGKE